jgi:hypothetical protein
MRNSTVSVSEETRTNPTRNQRFSCSKIQQIQQFSSKTSCSNVIISTHSALKIAQKTPSQNAKLRVKLWAPLQPQQNSPLKIAYSTATQP